METISPIVNILPRLNAVKNVPQGWKACCPAHADTNPSLSIAEGDDRRVLLKCWAGCEVLDIVHALGLELSDLFDKEGGFIPSGRPIRPNWRDIAQLFFHDATVVMLCAEKLHSTGSLTTDDLDCLKTSYQSICAIIKTTEALEMPKRRGS